MQKTGKLIMIVGMPGSGKTWLIEHVFGILPGNWIRDDYFATGNYEELSEALKRGENGVISDIELCNADRREEIVARLAKDLPEASVEYHCFKNQRERCLANIRRRNRSDGNEAAEKVGRLSRDYSLPAGAIMYDVWEADVADA